jgi:putative ABC transport system substrate-binding protein
MILIVFSLAADLVQSGLVPSFAQPGGSLTGIALGLYEDKMLDLLKQAVPGTGRVACPCRQDPRDISEARIVDAARGLGVE